MQTPRFVVRARRAVLSATALGAGLLACPSAMAQTAPTAAQDEAAEDTIVVTGTRIERPGFDAPTPTTTLNEDELQIGNRTNIGLVLQDLPSVRPTTSPSTTIGNTNSGQTLIDLRALGNTRTLTLVNGRRSASTADLSFIPVDLVKRVDIVTGGASAAWGSGAVAGVVNIILDDDFKGLRLSADTGVSSRGDGARYGFRGAFGTHSRDGRLHVMAAAEYFRDRGIIPRGRSRPNTDAGTFTTTAGALILARDVNYTNASPGGVITSGALRGMIFNSDGTLSPFPYGSESNSNSTIGGGGSSWLDYSAISAPYQRVNSFARASFDISSNVTLWVQGNWGRISSNYPYFPDEIRATATSGLLIQASNPFLSDSVRSALAAAGQTSFRMGKLFTDPVMGFKYSRGNFDVSLGIDGSFGESWRYSAFYDHGETRWDMSHQDQRILANFNNAIDAVRNPAGQIVCRVALTDPTTACRPLNIFGAGNGSAEATAYAYGDTRTVQNAPLDVAGVNLRGNLFSTWAGPVSIATGVDWRREAITTSYISPLLASRGVNYGASALDGSFSVLEGFGEVAIPLLDIAGKVKIDANGAARYSDYSTSGGIWSWKGGATARLFDDLLLRAVYSRDIRSPGISELFATRRVSITNVVDPFQKNITVSPTVFTGGNPNLLPETANTLTLGGSYSPHFIPRLQLSIDYYRIDIDGLIGSIGAQLAINQCYAGNQVACTTIERDSAGNISTVYASLVNLAWYKTRGIDFDLSYRVPIPQLDGSLTFRGLATYVDSLKINNGVTTIERAGDVGDFSGQSTPKWKISGNVTLKSGGTEGNVRVRYVDGGTFDRTLAIVNNDVSSRVYVDIGLSHRIDQFEIYTTVNNLFDRDPPFSTYGGANYDMVGRYFSGGVKLRF